MSPHRLRPPLTCALLLCFAHVARDADFGKASWGDAVERVVEKEGRAAEGTGSRGNIKTLTYDGRWRGREVTITYLFLKGALARGIYSYSAPGNGAPSLRRALEDAEARLLKEFRGGVERKAVSQRKAPPAPQNDELAASLQAHWITDKSRIRIEAFRDTRGAITVNVRFQDKGRAADFANERFHGVEPPPFF